MLTITTLGLSLCFSPAGLRAGPDMPVIKGAPVRLLATNETGARLPMTNETGVRLLEAELAPAKVTLLKAKCEQLVIAVGKTTLAHPEEARTILWAALARRIVILKKKDEPVATLPCTCARRIFLASIAAAPKMSSQLLELAVELYPDCAGEFASALGDFESEENGFDSNFSGPPLFRPNSPIGIIVVPVTSVVNG